jgi:predicted RNase H-like HicB family nuclease
MKTYHIQVQANDGWLIGRVLERPGVCTQGRTLDELVFMVRDAIELLWSERNVHLELLVPSDASPSKGRKSAKMTGVRSGKAKSQSGRAAA